jgi:hypothetical protein
MKLLLHLLKTLTSAILDAISLSLSRLGCEELVE